jgi:hypothetical protein
VKPPTLRASCPSPGSGAARPRANVIAVATTTIVCTGCHNHDRQGAGRQQPLGCEWRLRREWRSGVPSRLGGAQDWAVQARKLDRKGPKSGAVPMRSETGSAQPPTRAMKPQKRCR